MLLGAHLVLPPVVVLMHVRRGLALPCALLPVALLLRLLLLEGVAGLQVRLPALLLGLRAPRLLVGLLLCCCWPRAGVGAAPSASGWRWHLLLLLLLLLLEGQQRHGALCAGAGWVGWVGLGVCGCPER